MGRRGTVHEYSVWSCRMSICLVMMDYIQSKLTHIEQTVIEKTDRQPLFILSHSQGSALPTVWRSSGEEEFIPIQITCEARRAAGESRRHVNLNMLRPMKL